MCGDCGGCGSAGQRQEDVVEGGSAQGQIGHPQPGVGKPGGGLDKDGRPILDWDDHTAGISVHMGCILAQSSQRGRDECGVLAGEGLQFQAVASEAGLELGRRYR